MEHGALSELMAAVLYLPSLVGDAGVNGRFFLINNESLSMVLLVGLVPVSAMENMDPRRQ